MDILDIPGCHEAIQALSESWHAASSMRQLHVNIIESTEPCLADYVARSFLNKSNVPYLTAEAATSLGRLLPLYRILQSVVELPDVQEQLTIDPEHLTVEWRSVLSSFASLQKELQISGSSVWDRLSRYLPDRVSSLTMAGDDDIYRDASLANPTSLQYLGDGISQLASIRPLAIVIPQVDLIHVESLRNFGRLVLSRCISLPLHLILTSGQAKPFDGLVDALFSTLELTEPQCIRQEILSDASEDISREEDPDAQIAIQEREPSLTALFHTTIREDPFLYSGILYRWREENPKISVELSSIIDDEFARFPKASQQFLLAASSQDRMFSLDALGETLGIAAEQAQIIANDLENGDTFWIEKCLSIADSDHTCYWYRFPSTTIFSHLRNRTSRTQSARLRNLYSAALERLLPTHRWLLAEMLAGQRESSGELLSAASHLATAARQANRQGNRHLGKEFASRGLANLGETRNIQLLIQLHFERGFAQRYLGGGPEALRDLETSYNLVRETADSTRWIDIGKVWAEALINDGRWAQGSELAATILNEACEREDYESIRFLLDKLWDRYRRRADEGFIELCDRLITRIQERYDDLSKAALASIYLYKARFRYSRRELPAAMSEVNSAARSLSMVARPQLFPDIHSQIFQRMSLIRYLQADFTHAIEYADKSLEWAEVSGDRRLRMRVLTDKGEILAGKGDIDSAVKAFEEAIATATVTSDIANVADVEQAYGLAVSRAGLTKRALELYISQENHRRMVGDYEGRQLALNNVAAMQKRLGEFEASAMTFQRLLNEGRVQDNKARQAVSLNHLGDILRMQGDLLGSVRQHQQAYRLHSETHSVQSKAITLRFWAQALLVDWELDEASDKLHQALELSAVGAVAPTVNRAATIIRHRLELARGNEPSHVTRSIVADISSLVSDKIGAVVGNAYINLGLAALCSGNSDEAKIAVNRAQHAFAKAEDWRVAEVDHLLARIYLAQGELQRAQQMIGNAKSEFVRLKLMKRLRQLDHVESLIVQASSVGHSQWASLGRDELRYTFNFVGI